MLVYHIMATVWQKGMAVEDWLTCSYAHAFKIRKNTTLKITMNKNICYTYMFFMNLTMLQIC